MTTAMRMDGVPAVNAHDLQIFARFQSHGGADVLSLPSLDRLIGDCIEVGTPEMMPIIGCLALETAFYYSQDDSPDKIRRALRMADEFSFASIVAATEHADHFRNLAESHRQQLAYAALPIYANLALNEPITTDEFAEHNYQLAYRAKALIASTQEYLLDGDHTTSHDYDGLIAELIYILGFNRAALTGQGGMLGFALLSTHRQDNVAYDKEYVGSKAIHAQRKSNWDASIIVRNTLPGSELARTLGRLGQTAMVESGLNISPTDLWRYVAKVQVKTSGSVIINSDGEQNGRTMPSKSRSNGKHEQVQLPIRDSRIVANAGQYDQNDLVLFGIAEELGINNPKALRDTLAALAGEILGEKLDYTQKSLLKKISTKIKTHLMVSLDRQNQR